MSDVRDPPFHKSPRIKVFLAILLLTSGIASGGCRRADPPKPSATVQAGTVYPTVAAVASPPGGGMNGTSKSLLQLLGDERASRPTGTPTVDEVLGAAQKAGVPTTDRSQVLARLLGASYCENAHTAHGVVLSVCEFKDSDTLEKGKSYSEKTFGKSLSNRTLVSNRMTLLTINPPDGTDPVVKNEVKAITGAFSSL